MKLVTLCLLVAAAWAYSHEEAHDLFETFKEDFNKTYEGEEHDHRLHIFKKNLKTIQEHNEKNLGWQMGIGPFADLTGEEFKKDVVGGCYHAFRRRRDTVNAETVVFNVTHLEDSVDWTTKGVVTAVKNQGSCGSCWSFSATGCIESRSAIKTGKLVSLSEQELVDCSQKDGNKGCKGGLMDDAFRYVEQMGGLCSEQDYPYKAKTEQFECSSDRSRCSQRYDAISGYKDVQRNSEQQLMAAVAQGPVSIAVEADQSAWQHYKSGVLSGTCGAKLDHGVLAVGYGNDGDDFWKVKNSWGTRWGEEGYIRLCRGCSKNFGKGECGILSDPSFVQV